MTNEPSQVLVVDDDDLARLEIVRIVEKQGHNVSQAGNGTQALEMLRAGKSDLVLLDLLMPGIDGFEVLQQMKSDSTLSDIPVIVITAAGDPGSATKSIELGAIDHFTKPVDHELLANRIGAILVGAG